MYALSVQGLNKMHVLSGMRYTKIFLLLVTLLDKYYTCTKLLRTGGQSSVQGPAAGSGSAASFKFQFKLSN